MEQIAFMVKVAGISQAKQIMIESMRTRRQIDILYVRENGSVTVRTIEPFEFTHNRNGDSYVRSMDHKTGEVRPWRLDRILGYLPSDNPFTLDVPEEAEPEQWTRTDRVQDGG